MKKKILAACLVVCLLATAVIGTTLAYFTDTNTAENTFSVGNVKIELTEPQWLATGMEEAETMYPGEAVAKDPTVKNVGANPCFVRVKVQMPEEDVNIQYRTDYEVGKLGDGWVDGADGYFYYTKVLGVNETADALFDQIVLDSSTKNGTGANMNIVVTAEAVQAQGAKPSWAAVQTMTVAEIQAWFTTVMA